MSLRTHLTRADLIRSLPIRSDDFVVEIGAGQVPFRYTKLILEKFPFNDYERWGDTKNVAPIIKADAHKLPLADKSCDWLFMSHVIEHLDHPEGFLMEARRCARFIYLEFPKRPLELMYAWSFHKWLIEVDGNALRFYRNDIPQVFGDFFHRHYDFLLDVWEERRFEDLNHHMFMETEQLQFEFPKQSAYEQVLRNSANGSDKINYKGSYGQDGTSAFSYTARQRMKIIAWAATPKWAIQWRRRLHDRSNARHVCELTETVLNKMSCQICRHNPLTLDRGSSYREVVCPSCGTRYADQNGIFDFDL